MNRENPGSCPIITLRPGGAEPGPDEELLHYLQTRRTFPFELPAALREDLTSNRHGLDGVVLHGTFNPPMATLGKWLRKIGLPYLFIPHDPYVPALMGHKRWRKAIYWKFFEKPLIEGAAAVQLLDESHEAPLRARGVRTQAIIIPNGCEVSMADELPTDARVPGSNPDDIRVLYFGRMDSHHKGLDLLINGFACALSLSPQATVTLIMTGNDWTDRAELEKLAERLGIGNHVRFTGRRPENAMTIVAEADLVILPSRFDGFGLCIVEAMLAARPVIVSSAAGVAGQVKKTGGGWITAPSAISIADTLQDALAARDRWPEMGRANRHHVLHHLTWDQIATTTAKAYREVFEVNEKQNGQQR
jgi:glycosyltransferase involved in cell wall biosynthesis